MCNSFVSIKCHLVKMLIDNLKNRKNSVKKIITILGRNRCVTFNRLENSANYDKNSQLDIQINNSMRSCNSAMTKGK